MSITYNQTISKPMNDSFSISLKETQDYFNQKYKTSIIGRNFEDILTTNSLYEDYIEKLTEGFDATQTEQIESLANSFRETCLSESLSGVQPYASLTMPIIVKLWARLSLKYALPTEPVTVPAFSVAYFKPYILDADGVTKHYLPESINMPDNNLAELRVLPMNNGTPVDVSATGDGSEMVKPVGKGWVVLKGGQTSSIDPVTTEKVTFVDMYNGMTVSNAHGKLKPDETSKWAVDKKVTITDIRYVIGDTYDENDETTYKDVKVTIKLDLYRRLYGDVFYTYTDPHSSSLVEMKDTVFGSVDLEHGKLTFTSMSGKAIQIKVLAYLSSETHQVATNIDFDVDKRDIEIGTGEHIEANLPLEFLQDTKAMYQIDGAAELVDIMSNVSAQKVDQSIWKFLEMSYAGTDRTLHKKFQCISFRCLCN